MKLTQKKLKQILNYDPLTGVFTRKVTLCNRAIAGSVAGSLDKDGYTQIGISGKHYHAHRLAWLYVYGYFPEHDIDHIDRDKSNNKIDNLRHATRQCNIRNTGLRCTNTSGIKGACWDKQQDKWRAQITVNNKQHHLGYFTDFTEAVCTRLAAEQCLCWDTCDSNTSANDYVNCNLINNI